LYLGGWTHWPGNPYPLSTGTNNKLGLAAVSWGHGRTDVFAVDTQSHLRHSWGPNLWDDWGSPPGYSVLVGTPAVTSWGPQRLDVFILAEPICFPTSCPPHVFHAWYDAGTESNPFWQDIGVPAPGIAPATGVSATFARGVASGPPSAIGTINVFVMGNDGNVWRAQATGGGLFSWTGTSWGTPGGTYRLLGTPAVASNSPHNLDVVFRDNTGELWSSWGPDNYYGGASGWALYPNPGVAITGDPGVADLGDGRYVWGAHGSDNVPYVELWQFGGAAGWVSLGGSTYGAIAFANAK
jgi:hypothetical protein